MHLYKEILVNYALHTLYAFNTVVELCVMHFSVVMFFH